MAASLLNPAVLQDLALSWLREDQPSLDVGLYVVGEADCTAYLWCKSPGVLAGVPFANAVLAQLDCDIKWLRNEGEWLHPVAKVAELAALLREPFEASSADKTVDGRYMDACFPCAEGEPALVQ
nr:nicotinate-nucleotide pyrophosphorylase [carboxylating]-like [Rhipicephalus microplus]